MQRLAITADIGPMRRLSILAIAALTWACSQRGPRTPAVVLNDVGRFTLRVKERGGDAAKACRRATSGAAIAVANVLGPLTRKEAVPAERYAALHAADRTMQSACVEFR